MKVFDAHSTGTNFLHFNVLTLILACNVCISPIHLPQMDGSLLLYHESIKARLYHLTRNLHLLNEHST